MKTLFTTTALLGLLIASPVHAQFETASAQGTPELPLPSGKQPVVSVPAENAPGAIQKEGTPSTRTLEQPGAAAGELEIPEIKNPLDQVSQTQALTAEQLAALSAEDLEVQDPFATSAAAVGARAFQAAQSAVNLYTISGLIHRGENRIAAIRLAQNQRGGQRNNRVQLLSLEGDRYLKIPSQPQLRLKVLEIKESSVTFEVEGTNEVVTVY